MEWLDDNISLICYKYETKNEPTKSSEMNTYINLS